MIMTALVNVTFFQASGGSISFVKGDVSLDANADSSRDKEAVLLVYVNGSHEYVIFDPRKSEEVVVSKNTHKKIQAEEPGEYCMVCCIVLECIILLLATVSQIVFCGKQAKHSSNAASVCQLCCAFQKLFAGFFFFGFVSCAKMIFSHFLSTS